VYRIVFLAMVAVALVSIGFGCSIPRAPISTMLYADVQDGMLANAGEIPATLKTGEATATSILSITTGDASIDAARKAGQIKKIYYVDYHSKCILGVWATTTTKVYGE